MEINTPQYKTYDEKIFYSRGRWFMLVLTILIFLMSVLSLGVGDSSFVLMLLLLLIVGFITWNSFNSYLLIHADGLVWVSGTEKIYIGWDEISGFEVRQQGGGRGGKKTTYGLRLHSKFTPQRESSNFLGELFPHFTDFIPLSDYVHVPTIWHLFGKSEIDTEQFRDTAFGSKLYQYIPHIF